MGYASEALSAILTWADNTLKGPLCCIIDEENQRSIHLAGQFGFQFQHQATYHGNTLRVYTRPSPSESL